MRPETLTFVARRCARRQLEGVYVHQAVFTSLTAESALVGTLSGPTGEAGSWVRPDTEGRIAPDRPWSRTLLMTRATMDAVGVAEGEPVRLSLPLTVCSVGPALLTAPLDADEVMCASQLFPDEERLLLIRGRRVAMMRVRRTEVDGMPVDRVRLSAYARQLLGVSSLLVEDRLQPYVGSNITVMPASPVTNSAPDRPMVGSGPTRGDTARLVVRRWWRAAALAADAAGGRLVGTPEASLISTRASLGDDGLRVVRVSPDVIQAISARSGSTVFVRWGPKQAVGVLLADRTDEQEYEFGRPVGPDHGSVDTAFRASIPLAIRSELGLPPGAVVQVRRRVVAEILAQLNIAVLPLAGIVAAMLAIPDLSPVAAVVGMVAVVALALVPIRHPRAPRGLW